MNMVDLTNCQNSIYLFKNVFLQFANLAEKEELENATITGEIVKGSEYIKQFPTNVVNFMKKLKEQSMTASQIIKTIKRIQKENNDLSFGIFIGKLLQKKL